MTEGGTKKLKVFISYAHKDDELREKLVTHLAQLRNDGLIEEWHDRQLTGGQEWAGQIDEHLEKADIVLLLISADFINSKYCYDVEMNRALERHHAGQARVIPVILRPCDWKSAPFGKLQAFPKDGNPVEDWKTLDHGFLDVAHGLRKVVEKLAGTAPPAPGTVAAPSPPPEPTPLWLKVMVAVAIIAIVAAAAGAGWWWRQRDRMLIAERQELSVAEGCLQTGLYPEAKAAYERALIINPRSELAKFGMKKIALTELTGHREKFSHELDALLKQAPEDPDLVLFDGDRYYRRGENDEAVRRYERVLQKRQEYAEAHFRLGLISAQAGDAATALNHYGKAVEFGGDTPTYRNNLANAYYKQGDYDRAIEGYRRIPKFPLAGLEWAKIAWMKGDLETAVEGQMFALQGLEDQSVATMPKNQWPWRFEVEGRKEPVHIDTLPEKICYAKLALSATLFLQGKETDSEIRFKQAVESCADRTRRLKVVLEADLALAAEEQPKLAARIEAYRRRFLSN